jgi:hypothetical protein
VAVVEQDVTVVVPVELVTVTRGPHAWEGRETRSVLGWCRGGNWREEEKRKKGMINQLLTGPSPSHGL